MKKAAVCACFALLLAVILLTGCVNSSPECNNYDTRAFYVNFKMDPDSPDGKKAALYDGRIYYLSDESGTQGLHSMAQDGTGVRLEFKAADIRALNLRGDGIYYSCYLRQAVNSNGEYRAFRPYFRAWGGGFVRDLFSSLPQEEWPVGWSRNVWDLYKAADGTLLIRSVFVKYPQGWPGSFEFLLEEKTITKIWDNPPVWELREVPGSNCDRKLELYAAGEKIVTGVNLYDADAHRLAFSNDLLFHSVYDDYYSYRQLCRVDGELLYYFSNEELLAVNMETLAARQLAAFTPPERVFAAHSAGRQMYLLTMQGLNRAKGEALWRVDIDAGTQECLLQLDRGDAFAYLDDTLAVTAKKKTLSIYRITGEAPVLLRTVELSDRVVDKANKIDAAGGWLFLYRFDNADGRDELIEKVYLR